MLHQSMPMSKIAGSHRPQKASTADYRRMPLFGVVVVVRVADLGALPGLQGAGGSGGRGGCRWCQCRPTCPTGGSRRWRLLCSSDPCYCGGLTRLTTFQRFHHGAEPQVVCEVWNVQQKQRDYPGQAGMMWTKALCSDRQRVACAPGMRWHTPRGSP